MFVDNAKALVTAKMPAATPRGPRSRFLTAQEILLKHGITATADMGTTIEDWQGYRRAGDAGDLRIRIMGYAAASRIWC